MTRATGSVGLRAIARNVGGLIEAQLLELDIAVSASNVDDLVREIEHAIIAEYMIAREHGFTPFAAIAHRTPEHFKAWWPVAAAEGDRSLTTRDLNLPDEVMDALAIALHTPGRPSVIVGQYALAA